MFYIIIELTNQTYKFYTFPGFNSSI